MRIIGKKFWLSIALLAASGIVSADKGGNSSGGDEISDGGTLPVMLSLAQLGGVVESVAEDSSKGRLAPFYRVKFSRHFVGNQNDVLVSGYAGSSVRQIKKGSIAFVARQPASDNVGNESVWYPLKPWVGGAEQERAIESYLASDKPEDRFRWSETYLKHSDVALRLSARRELASLSSGLLRGKVLELVLGLPLASFKVQFLGRHYLAEPKIKALLKEIAIDGKVDLAVRLFAAEPLLSDRAQLALWKDGKDGKDGADNVLQGRAIAQWNRLHPPPPRSMSDEEFEKLKADLALKPSRTGYYLMQASEFAYHPRLFALFEKAMFDTTLSNSDRRVVVHHSRRFPLPEVAKVLAKLALDETQTEDLRFSAIRSLGMAGYPNKKALLEEIEKKANLKKLRDAANAFGR